MTTSSGDDDELTATYRQLSATVSFDTWAGFEVTRMADGECELTMSWRAADMGQYAGFLHAGIIAALLDTACGFAANTKAAGVLSSNLAVPSPQRATPTCPPPSPPSTGPPPRPLSTPINYAQVA